MPKQSGWWSIPGSGYTVMRVMNPYVDFTFCLSIANVDGPYAPNSHDTKYVK